MDRLLAVGQKHGIPVIEDAAEAIGSISHGKRAGSMGRFGTFSFHTDPRELNGETDRVHVLVYHPPGLPLAVLVNRLKDVSLRRCASSIPRLFGNNCGASTSGHRPTSPPPAAAPH